MDTKILQEKFTEFVYLSDRLRRGYKNSLENGLDVDSLRNKLKFLNKTKILPQLISVIYSNVSGTRTPVIDEKLMDFIPGFRLIYIEELEKSFFNVKNHLAYSSIASSFDKVIPFLTNYSSDYICVASNGEKEIIYDIFHDEENPIQKHNSSLDFLLTLIEFYKQGVYELDEDGYLDYDYELEGIVGARLNPNIPFWKTT